MTFRRDVVLELAAHRAIHHEQTGLMCARHRSDPRHVDVLFNGDRLLPAHAGIDAAERPHPTTIEPEDVHFSVVGHQLLDLRCVPCRRTLDRCLLQQTRLAQPRLLVALLPAEGPQRELPAHEVS